jgi:hypothetical protein
MYDNNAGIDAIRPISSISEIDNDKSDEDANISDLMTLFLQLVSRLKRTLRKENQL